MTTPHRHRIAIIGAGSWGIGLGALAHSKGHDVALWEFRPDVCEELDRKRTAPKLLPDFSIPPELQFTSNLAEAIDGAQLLILVIPSHTVRAVAKQLNVLHPTAPIVTATKGLELKTHLRMSQVLAEELPAQRQGRIAVLSGPSHAEEVVKNFPTSVVVACENVELAHEVQHILSGSTFRIYASADVVGVEMAGALKNVIAIAAGVSDGLGFGDNTKSMLMTRGLVEISRLGMKFGGQPATFSGLSGLGDLITTCTSLHSRNRFVGEQLGKGRKIDEILREMTMVAEGVNATAAAVELSAQYGVEMPIAQAMYDVMFSGKEMKQVALELMLRKLKRED